MKRSKRITVDDGAAMYRLGNKHDIYHTTQHKTQHPSTTKHEQNTTEWKHNPTNSPARARTNATQAKTNPTQPRSTQPNRNHSIAIAKVTAARREFLLRTIGLRQHFDALQCTRYQVLLQYGCLSTGAMGGGCQLYRTPFRVHPCPRRRTFCRPRHPRPNLPRRPPIPIKKKERKRATNERHIRASLNYIDIL